MNGVKINIDEIPPIENRLLTNLRKKNELTHNPSLAESHLILQSFLQSV